jgi:hypothetical protein
VTYSQDQHNHQVLPRRLEFTRLGTAVCATSSTW